MILSAMPLRNRIYYRYNFCTCIMVRPLTIAGTVVLQLLVGTSCQSPPSGQPRLVLTSLLSRSSPTTPAAVLEPWEILQDPNPLPTIDELEQTAPQKEIDALVNQVVGTEPGILIQRFRPHPRWLWRQWFGTVLFHTFPTVLFNMSLALLFCWIVRRRYEADWDVWLPPPSGTFPRLEAIDKIWKTLMSLATFLLTFFVGQAYTFWRTLHDQGRGIQGRLNDINMLLAANGASVALPPNKKQTIKEPYTDEALAFLNSTATKLRVCHLLFWAANAPRFRILLTPRGLDRLVQVGFLPPLLKAQVLDATHGLPPARKWMALLESALMDCQEALVNPKAIQRYSNALEHALLDQFCRLRAFMATIPDQVDGRMPLAYAHFVQILVDLFLVVAPIAQYPEMGVFSVVLVGILTLFYRGLLDLAKVFLDPLDSEDYCEGAVYLNLAVFIREANAASTRWILGGRAAAAATSPTDKQHFAKQ